MLTSKEIIGVHRVSDVIFSGIKQRETVSDLIPLTVLTVSSGGLSLMSLMLMRAVAVLDKPKLRLPSMSVAWTMIVYWDTFWKQNDITD